jgi:hypothetical protein
MMNLGRILARLKNERRRIDKAISALEKVRDAESRGQGQGTANSKKQRSRVRRGPDGQRDKGAIQEQSRRGEAKVIALAPSTREAS